MKFTIKDNYGNQHISKEYIWNREEGIPPEEKILEDMEECTCSLNESDAYCDGSCCTFENGKVTSAFNQFAQ